jgi:hypothetical protein
VGSLLEFRDRSRHFDPVAVRMRDRFMTLSSPFRHLLHRSTNEIVACFRTHDTAMTFFSFVHLHDSNAFQNRHRNRDIPARRDTSSAPASNDARNDHLELQGHTMNNPVRLVMMSGRC